MTYFSLAKLSDFYLIFTEVPLGDKAVSLYLTPGPTWHWSTDLEDARRFQYAREALSYAYDHCPIPRYRYEAFNGEGWIELDFKLERCTIHRDGRANTITFETLYELRAMQVPTPKRPTT